MTGLPHILFVVGWVFFNSALVSCSNGGGSSETAVSATTSATSSEQIVTWGDSTTSGVGASDSGLSYPAQLQALTGRSTFNGGVSAQTSDQIAAREGGAPALLTFPNNTLPATGTVAVAAASTFPVSAEGPGPITGTISGFHGVLNYQTDANNNPQLTFTRDVAGSAEPIPAQVPFYPDTFGREAQINVFWMGQNNFYDTQGVESDIAKSIAFLANKKFIVMSLLNSGDEGIGTDAYNQLALINADLARNYPDNFLDIREILVNNYNPTNPQDVQDRNKDTAPHSLRSDNEHLNDKGYAIVAQQVAAFVAAKGW